MDYTREHINYEPQNTDASTEGFNLSTDSKLQNSYFLSYRS